MINSLIYNVPHVTQGWKQVSQAWKRPLPVLQLKNWENQSFKYLQKPLVSLAALIYAITTPLFAVVDFACTYFSGRNRVKKLDGGCDNFFEGHLYSNYHTAYKEHFKAVLKEIPALDPLLSNKTPPKDVLEKAFGTFSNLVNVDLQFVNKGKNRKKHYQDTINAFGLVVKEMETSKSDLKPAIINFCENLVKKRFCEISLLGDLEALHSPYSQSKTLGDLPGIFKKMELDPARKIYGCVEGLFDANYFGNVPFFITSVDLPKQQKILMIRMPTIAKDYFPDKKHRNVEVRIADEFQVYLNAFSKAGKKHLYVNLMVRNHGNEGHRSKAIEKLDRITNTPIRVLGLDKDSDFYHQHGSFNHPIMSAEEFKVVFGRRLLAEDGDYYLPKGTPHKLIIDVIDSVHQNYFGGRAKLEVRERQNFIESVYCHLIEKLAAEHAVSTMNISCKHCIDRGASQNFIFLNHMRAKGLASISDRDLMTLLLSPSIMVANRPIRLHYLERAHLFNQQMRFD